MKILALIFNGFEEEEAMAPFALLRRAKADLTIASIDSIVTGCHNISISNVTLLNTIDYKDYDCLLIPGGPHFKFLRESKLVHEIINYYFQANKFVAGICATPTIFGALGHLKGKNYTCFTSMNSDFGGFYHDDGVVVDGKLITSRSVAYSLDFAYAIIRETMGMDVLNTVWEHIYYEK
jgi:putative intracellular protease/amidase